MRRVLKARKENDDTYALPGIIMSICTVMKAFNLTGRLGVENTEKACSMSGHVLAILHVDVLCNANLGYCKFLQCERYSENSIFCKFLSSPGR